VCGLLSTYLLTRQPACTPIAANLGAYDDDADGYTVYDDASRSSSQTERTQFKTGPGVAAHPRVYDRTLDALPLRPPAQVFPPTGVDFVDERTG
jgi:hypothetical protein